MTLEDKSNPGMISRHTAVTLTVDIVAITFMLFIRCFLVDVKAIIKLYLYRTFHITHAAQSALQNDTSQVKFPSDYLLRTFKRYMQQNETFDHVNRHKEVKCMIIQIK